MIGIDTTVTYLQSYLTADYADLVRAFGPPMAGDSYKTDAEWVVRVNDTTATIYNWKNGPSYCGADGIPVEQITRWNVGGRSQAAVRLVERLLEGLR
jgi:hypothetical protein